MLRIYLKRRLANNLAHRLTFTSSADFSSSQIVLDSPIVTNDSKLLKALKLAEEEKEKQNKADKNNSCAKNSTRVESETTSTIEDFIKVSKGDNQSPKNGMGSTEKINRKTMDYSWLPKAPKLKSASARNVRLESLYSGYRPLFLEYKNINESSLHKPLDGRLLLEALEEEEVSIWSYSATEAEYFPEWNNVPVHVANNLKPFDKNCATPRENSVKRTDANIANENSKKEETKVTVAFEEDTNAVPIISKGRKRYLPGKYIQDVKLRQAKKIELQRLLSNKNKKTS